MGVETTTGAQGGHEPQDPIAVLYPAATPTSHAKIDAQLLADLRAELDPARRGPLTVERRKELAARLLEHHSRDETFFTRLAQRLQMHGLEPPSVTLDYRGLTVETEALLGSASIPTVVGVPISFAKRLLGLHRGRESRSLTILHGVHGRLKPGRLTLLLGPPSCGKSTFMRALTGRLMPAHGQMSGDIRYNDLTPDEFHIRRTAAYVEQFDNHNPNLTVRETLDFAHTCQVGLHGAAFSVPVELAAARLASQRSAAARHGGAPAGVEGLSGYGGSTYSAAGSSMYGNGNGNGAGHGGAEDDPNGANGHHEAQGRGGSVSSPKRSGGSRVKRLLSGRHEQRSALEEAGVEDEFEMLLREAWGTVVRVDLVMALLGLSHCAETFVGDQLLRGISGGERKRLTTAEMLVGPCKVAMLDEISTGLDSATLFTVVRWLGQATRALGMTMVVSLLQPPPEVFGLFDDLILMTEGRILYHGPVADVLPHFRDLGFECPDRKDVPSFLLEITTPHGQRQFAGPELRVRFNLPPPEELQPARTASAPLAPISADMLAAANASVGGPANDASGRGSQNRHKAQNRSLLLGLPEMEEAFWTRNKHGVTMTKELREAEAPQPGSPASPQAAAARAARPAVEPPLVPLEDAYALSPWDSVKAATARQWTLVRRDKVLLKGRMMQVIVLGMLSGGLFFGQGLSMTAARTIFGASFMGVLFMSFGAFPQIPIVMEQKKVWYKHRAASFYPAYAQGLAMALTQLPLSCIESVIYSLIMYFMVGYYREPGYFFTYVLILISASLAVSAMFRFVGCLCPNMVIANALCGIVIVGLVLTSGFAIVHGAIPAWVIWLYWLSPYGWALRALVINEMVSPKWQNVPAPHGMATGLSLGDAALESFDFYRDRFWIWAGVGYMWGIFLLFTVLAVVSLRVQQPEVPAAQLPDPAEVAEARRRAAERHERLQSNHAATTAARKQGEAVIEVRPPRAPDSGKGRSDSSGGGASDGSGAVAAVGGGERPRLAPEGGKGMAPEGGKGMVVSPSTAALQDYIDITSSLPFTPVTLVFQNLTYTVPNPSYSRAAAKAAAKAASDTHQAAIDAHAVADPEAGKGGKEAAAEGAQALPLAARERLQLLSGITGFNEPGVMLALMGGSGAGKTTLMDVIAGRKTIGEIGGTITVNGHTADPRAWSRVMGYVEQNDIHTPAQTVVEALQFSARLRLPPSCSNQQVKAYVEEVLDIVDLLPLLNSLVGSPGDSGLSTEARKRLTIAVELVANPSCIFLDEPTSGLDARAASIVMRAVRNIARNGRTVMVTIHQPSIEIFEAFDNLLLIQRGGRTTYFGPLGLHSSALIGYLMAVPGTPPLPSGFNPATWMLEVTGGSMATVLEAVQADWPALYDGSELAAQNEARAAALVEEGRQACEALAVGSQYAMPFGTQVRVLLRKYNLAYWRSPGYNFMRLGLTLTTSLIYAAIYWGEGRVPNPAAIANVQNVMGVMYSSSNFLGMTNLMSVMPIVGYERVVFYRERGAAMYDPFAYGLAIALVELPYLLAQALTFVPIVYWTVGFDPNAETFFHYIIIFLETLAFYTIAGQTAVYITPAQAIAQVLAGGFNFLFNIFNGFIITYPDMRPGWRWINRAVPPTWILYGLGISQLGNDEGVIIYAGETMPVEQFMEQRFGYHYYMRWWIVLILFAYIAVLRVGSIFALKYWNFLRR